MGSELPFRHMGYEVGIGEGSSIPKIPEIRFWVPLSSIPWKRNSGILPATAPGMMGSNLDNHLEGGDER